LKAGSDFHISCGKLVENQGFKAKNRGDYLRIPRFAQDFVIGLQFILYQRVKNSMKINELRVSGEIGEPGHGSNL
jgi:hypothetical protein